MTTGFLDTIERALVLAPHTDDEFGCAGTIVRLREGGAEVRYVAFSRCEESVPAGYERDVLERECRECLARLGVRNDLVDVLRFPVRHFPAHRQDILEILVRIAREYQPQLVLLPSRADTHQDHATISEEGFRAFKHASILGYELPQNITSSVHSAFVALDERQFDAKVAALSAYESQASRPYATREFIRSLAVVRGVQAGVSLAEAFELIRLIVR